jgi:hypothetical protein
MAVLTKEDGSIVAGANVYATLAEVDLYHEDRLSTVWTSASDEAKEAAMLRATAGLESKYRDRWVGYKANHNDANAPQLLAWPRKDDKSQTTANGFTSATMDPLVDYDGIEIPVTQVHPLVVQAYSEVCLIELSQPFVSVQLSRNDMLKYQRVDVIEQEWLRNAPAVVQFPHIDALLAGLASTAPVKLGASIGLTESEQDSISDTGAFDRWFESLLVP